MISLHPGHSISASNSDRARFSFCSDGLESVSIVCKFHKDGPDYQIIEKNDGGFSDIVSHALALELPLFHLP